MWCNNRSTVTPLSVLFARRFSRNLGSSQQLQPDNAVILTGVQAAPTCKDSIRLRQVNEGGSVRGRGRHESWRGWMDDFFLRSKAKRGGFLYKTIYEYTERTTEPNELWGII